MPTTPCFADEAIAMAMACTSQVLAPTILAKGSVDRVAARGDPAGGDLDRVGASTRPPNARVRVAASQTISSTSRLGSRTTLVPSALLARATLDRRRVAAAAASDNTKLPRRQRRRVGRGAELRLDELHPPEVHRQRRDGRTGRAGCSSPRSGPGRHGGFAVASGASWWCVLPAAWDFHHAPT